MRKGWFAKTRLYGIQVFIVVCLTGMLAGCASPKSTQAQHDDASDTIPAFADSYLLYIQSTPCPRLYVELLPVEGCAPNDATVEKLRKLLATYCDKPGGIEIVRDAGIPRESARGMEPETLARRFMHGPPDGPDAGRTAYACILFYDGALCGKPARSKANMPSWKASFDAPPEVRNPRTTVWPYPMIYMNTRYGPKSGDDRMLTHETGHLLGLAWRATRAAGGHCLDPQCLMFKGLIWHFHRAVLFEDPYTQNQFCPQCVAQLTNNAKLPPSKLRFAGPVLVRSETDYHVLTLPGNLKVIVGPLTEQDCADFAASVRSEPPGMNQEAMHWTGRVKPEVEREPAKALAILDAVEADPYDMVREIGKKLRVQAMVAKYRAEGNYDAYLKVCRQAVTANPKDADSYNKLAWLLATCPDASIRNGKEAIQDATKACELSGWKIQSFIDTLAAAYAESGDFKQAVAFEEKALGTGAALESAEQKRMQERLSLYQQSQPFREHP